MMSHDGGSRENKVYRFIKLSVVVFLLSMAWVTGCTSKDSSRPLPDETTYKSDTELMINICNKFANEPDVEKLHKAAVATQLSRIIQCTDYNEECSLYGQFLDLAIRLSKDGQISNDGRHQLQTKLAELKSSVEAGRGKLHQETLSKK